MKHTLIGGTEHTRSEPTGTTPGTGGHFSIATAIFEFTHGGPSFLQDKTTGVMGMGEISDSIHSRGVAVPPVNFAAIYACSGNPGSTLWAGAMGMYAADRAAVAFPFPVVSLLEPGNGSESIPGYQFNANGVPVQVFATGTLDQHSAKLMAELASGKVISAALFRANGEFPPRKFGQIQGDVQYLNVMNMQLCFRSDPDTRLKKLYKLESEDGYVQKADWYKLYEDIHAGPGGPQ